MEKEQEPKIINSVEVCKHIPDTSFSVQNGRMMAFCMRCGATYEIDES